jgi:hypothetical protein
MLQETFRRSRQNYSVADDTLHGGRLSRSIGLMEMSQNYVAAASRILP